VGANDGAAVGFIVGLVGVAVGLEDGLIVGDALGTVVISQKQGSGWAHWMSNQALFSLLTATQSSVCAEEVAVLTPSPVYQFTYVEEHASPLHTNFPSSATSLYPIHAC
jgi:hypothetical protein